MSKGRKVWFRWSNGQLQRVYIYEDFNVNSETWHRASLGKRTCVLKDSDYGHTWALTKEELDIKKP